MTLDDFEKLLRYSNEITIGFVALMVLAFVFKARGMQGRFQEQQAQRQAVAASLGFRAPGGGAKGMLASMAAAIADGPERFGPFQRFAGYPRVQIELEGDRRGMKATVLLHTPDTEEPRTTTTLVHFATPEIDVPAFRLERALEPFSPAVEAMLELAGRALKPLFGSGDPVIEFPDRPRFGQLYSLTSTFTVRIRDAFHGRVLDFFEKNPGWCVEGLNGRLLVCRNDVMEPPERVADFVSEAAAVAEVFRRPPA